jgi:predicted thioesterase
MIAQKVSKQTEIKSTQTSVTTTQVQVSTTIRTKIAAKQSRKVLIIQKKSRKTISKIKTRKISVEREKASKKYKTKRKNEHATSDDKSFFLKENN